jgi:hypothetical protein
VRTTLRFAGALAAAVLCVAVVGACGGDDGSAQSLPAADDGGGDYNGDDNSGDDNGGGDNGGGAPGIPGGNSGGGAPGAPIDIPALQQVGAPIEEVIPFLEEEIRKVCGGDLCVVVDVEKEGGEENCSFVGTEPPGGTSVERGSTVVVLARCESGSEGQTGGDGETETGDDETDGDGETETDVNGETDGNGETDIGTESDSGGTP